MYEIFFFLFLNVIQDLRRKSASRNFAADYLAPILAWPGSSSVHLLSSATEAAESDPPLAERMSRDGWEGKEMAADLPTQLLCFSGQRQLLTVEL